MSNSSFCFGPNYSYNFKNTSTAYQSWQAEFTDKIKTKQIGTIKLHDYSHGVSIRVPEYGNPVVVISNVKKSTIGTFMNIATSLDMSTFSDDYSLTVIGKSIDSVSDFVSKLMEFNYIEIENIDEVIREYIIDLLKK